jgi:transcriptional regulator of acetoin/glycerol metabolism
VRELEHALEHAFILCRKPMITIEHLPHEIKSFSLIESPLSDNGNSDDPEVILEALNKAAWNKTKAAALLGISRRSIYRKIKEFNITDKE